MAKYETQICVIAAGPAGLAAAVQLKMVLM
jgi:thioredoxin reductase